MSHRPACQTAAFFVLRSPGLPLDGLYRISDSQRGAGIPEAPADGLVGGPGGLVQIIRRLVQREAVREALALASPDLASRLGAWMAGTMEVPAARKLERALLKYLGRMSHRATPFGLFAGVSLGAWEPESHLSVGAWQACPKALRLDWGILESLVDRLEEKPAIRAGITYRPNSSLYARGGWYRYLERRGEAGGAERTYHLEAAEATAHLGFVLQQAHEGSHLPELAYSLAQHADVDPREAEAFLHQLIEAQVLCGDLQPPLTSPDPLGHVIQALQTHPSTAESAAPLLALAGNMKALEERPLGAEPDGYRRLMEPLADLGLPSEARDLLQVDLSRPAPGLALSPVVRRALEEGADLLRRLSPAPLNGPLEGPMARFRAAFQARYDQRWMPLLEVLDEESGLGFDGGVPPDSPLLDDLPFHRAAASHPLTLRDQALLARLPQWQGSLRWELEDADLDALSQVDPGPFAASFGALVSLEAPSQAALDGGEFQFSMEQYSGPTAARWLGRFASGDPALKAALEVHLQQEEALRPEALFAEVIHVPEGRMGNVLARPSLRSYEIPFMGNAGVSPQRRILPADLLLTVRGDRVWLASKRLGREVVPRLSSAHNFARGPAVYRFLAHLQEQDGRSGGWSWGALADLPFLPRVSRGRHVLSKARWRIEARELKGAAWDAFQALRAARGLPRFVVLSEADNHLLVDLDQALWVETLHHLVSGRPSFTLTECFPDPGQALLEGPEGRFTHELVIPFEAAPPWRVEPQPLPPLPTTLGMPVYPPGSEWLYLKLYCGPSSADRLLVELEPLLRRSKIEGLWDRWHFVRYRDPEPHLRLRFHGQAHTLLTRLLPQIHQHLEAALHSGLLGKWQVDTFEPEWERYGGEQGLTLVEAWFWEDSQHVLDQLVAGLELDQRWQAGLRHADAIWAALGLRVRERKTLAQSLRDSFRKEFGDRGEGAVAMGAKFRAMRRELEAGFPQVAGQSASGFRLLPRIREACDQGLIQGDLLRLAGSLSHMHLNRLLRSDHREYEWVLMEFLTRLYDSSLARCPGSPE